MSKMNANSLTIASLNCRRLDVYRTVVLCNWMKLEKIRVLALEETRLMTNSEVVKSDSLDLHMCHNDHGTAHTGVAFFINKHLVAIEDECFVDDDEGRILGIKLAFNDKKFNLINVCPAAAEAWKKWARKLMELTSDENLEGHILCGH